ncbi:MAG: hypothetical protein CM15mP125_3580 [Gammaproteobacteria bacterium]|nr:MAG: hypothetical protein CM15mP125_3580 [Gammaproteobacteria bacterium]
MAGVIAKKRGELPVGVSFSYHPNPVSPSRKMVLSPRDEAPLTAHLKVSLKPAHRVCRRSPLGHADLVETGAQREHPGQQCS